MSELPPGLEVTLTPLEQEIAQHVGRAQHLANQYFRTTNLRRSPRKDVEIHIEGVGGQIGFHRLSESPLYLSIESPPYRGWDTRYMKMRTDVKVMSFTGPGMRCLIPAHYINPENPLERCDAFAFFTGAFPTYNFIGLIRTLRVLSTTPVERFPAGSLNYCVDPKLLVIPPSMQSRWEEQQKKDLEGAEEKAYFLLRLAKADTPSPPPGDLI